MLGPERKQKLVSVNWWEIISGGQYCLYEPVAGSSTWVLEWHVVSPYEEGTTDPDGAGRITGTLKYVLDHLPIEIAEAFLKGMHHTKRGVKPKREGKTE